MPSSTMLDLAERPEEAFSAPLKTTKLAPVTEIKGGQMKHRTKHR